MFQDLAGTVSKSSSLNHSATPFHDQTSRNRSREIGSTKIQKLSCPENSTLWSVHVTTKSHEMRMRVAGQCLHVFPGKKTFREWFLSLNHWKSSTSFASFHGVVPAKEGKPQFSVIYQFSPQILVSKMGNENASSTDHATGDPANASNNEDLASSLANINQNLDKMASLLLKLCERPETGERPPSRIIQTVSLKRTLAGQENEGVTILTWMTISVFALVTSWSTQTTLKCSPSFKISPTVLTTITPPARKSVKNWLVLL